MTAAKMGAKRRWAVSIISAAVILAAVLLLFRSPVPAPSSAAPPVGSAIKLAPRGQDELAMRDLAPLFLPTIFNARPQEFRPPEPGGGLFDQDAIHLKFNLDNPSLRLPAPAVAPTSAVAALADVPGPLALSFGRADVSIPTAVASGGHVDVFADGHQDSLLGVTLPPEARPKATNGTPLTWQPLEFSAAVDPAGLVGPLVLTASSSVEEVDNYFRIYLAQIFRVGDRLPPGFYRIVVGP